MINRSEYRWLIIFISIVIVITTLPYAVGYLRQTTEMQFSGLIFNITDSNSYLAKMLRGAAGDWLFRTPYTVAEQSGAISFLPYLILGKFTTPPGQHDQLIFLFQLFRWGGIFFAILAVYRFAARFIAGISMRRWATLIVVFGGGAGWLVVLGLGRLWENGMPLEFYSPETFGFLSFLGIPHLLYSRALLILGMEQFLFSRPQRHHPGNTILFFLPWILIGFFQPISIMTAWAILSVFIFILWILRKTYSGDMKISFRQLFRNGLWICLATLPFFLYNFIAFRSDPVLSSWLQQNILNSPPIWEYFLAFIFILPFSIAGMRFLWKNEKVYFLFFLSWIAAFPILAYFPLPIQRRLPEGIWVFLVILGMIGISNFSKRARKWSITLVSAGMITTSLLLFGSFQSVITPEPPRFLSKAELEAMNFLQKPEFNNSHALASFEESNRIPAWAPVFLPTGHGPESVDLATIEPRIERFFAGDFSPQEEWDLLKEFQIEYIFHGPEERRLGDWSGTNRNFLAEVFQNGEFTIYQVTRK